VERPEQLGRQAGLVMERLEAELAVIGDEHHRMVGRDAGERRQADLEEAAVAHGERTHQERRRQPAAGMQARGQHLGIEPARQRRRVGDEGLLASLIGKRHRERRREPVLLDQPLA
jgi:hypothetical protein